MAEPRNGSPEFYRLLELMGDIHHRKSHDYASNSDPFANYHFAGKISQLFKNSDDCGFAGRIAEKLYRLANLDNSQKSPLNESIEDTETDICVIVTLWMADRRERRHKRDSLDEIVGYQIPYHNIDPRAGLTNAAKVPGPEISNIQRCTMCGMTILDPLKQVLFEDKALGTKKMFCSNRCVDSWLRVRNAKV